MRRRRTPNWAGRGGCQNGLPERAVTHCRPARSTRFAGGLHARLGKIAQLGEARGLNGQRFGEYHRR